MESVEENPYIIQQPQRWQKRRLNTRARVKPLWQQKLNKGNSMEDRRAHDRIDTIQEEVKKHLAEHARFEESLKTIADNTSELVEMVRGAKGLRSFVIWAAPIAAALAAAWAWMKTP